MQKAKKCGASDNTFEKDRKVYQKVIRRSKKKHWEKQISEAKSDRAIYKITGWHKLTDSFRAPPLTHEGITVTDIRSKINLLREKVLAPMADRDDIPDP